MSTPAHSYPQTEDTLRAAQLHQVEERRKIFEQTGILFTDDGRIFRETCPTCGYVATAKRSGQELLAMAAHHVAKMREA